jgi:hypothetical protein
MINTTKKLIVYKSGTLVFGKAFLINLIFLLALSVVSLVIPLPRVAISSDIITGLLEFVLILLGALTFFPFVSRIIFSYIKTPILIIDGEGITYYEKNILWQAVEGVYVFEYPYSRNELRKDLTSNKLMVRNNMIIEAVLKYISSDQPVGPDEPMLEDSTCLVKTKEGEEILLKLRALSIKSFAVQSFCKEIQPDIVYGKLQAPRENSGFLWGSGVVPQIVRVVIIGIVFFGGLYFLLK